MRGGFVSPIEGHINRKNALGGNGGRLKQTPRNPGVIQLAIFELESRMYWALRGNGINNMHDWP